jgi:hypothetical protein
MKIRETFATAIQDRVEPVVKVLDRRPTVLLGELQNLIVTPQWEQHLHQVLDIYTEAADRDDEQSIGTWISGFFGSGKSLMMKVLGVLLEGGELDGKPVHSIFMDRVPLNSLLRADLQRFLTICEKKITTTVVGGNIHSMQAKSDDALALATFKMFARQHEYTRSWPFAWAVEYHIEEKKLTTKFRQLASDAAGVPWKDLAEDPEIYLDVLYQAAADVLPDLFKEGVASVERAVNAAAQGGIDPDSLISRFRRWCEVRDANGRRHKMLIELDELGQWISSGDLNSRTMQVQALVETAAALGNGRIWLVITAHGDISILRNSLQQENYAKIVQRFGQQCKLSNDDISMVVEKRLLAKTQQARVSLQERFNERSGELTDIGSLSQAQRAYPIPDPERFPLFYPFLPWTVAIIPDVVKGIAQVAGKDEALSGSNRTMIAVVQGSIIDTPGLLQSQVGRLLNVADLYEQVVSDVPIETKTDIGRILESVREATNNTVRVAQALYLLGQAKYIPTTLSNVTRALVDALDTNLSVLSKDTEAELEKLVSAGYAKRSGEQYVFLSTQQRGFQDKVRDRRDVLATQSYDLGQALADYDSDDALRFDKVPLQGRELQLRLEIDSRVVRGREQPVAVSVYSPFQRAIDPQVANDTYMQQLSAQEPNKVFVRMADVPGLRTTLALAMATVEVAERVTSNHSSGPEVDVARQAKQVDLPTLKEEVRKLLRDAIRGATVFFRGGAYPVSSGDGPGSAMRSTIAQLLPSIYPRFSELTHRITNEETAVKAALNGNTTNADLTALGVYRADGTVNESHPLLSTLRGKLPLSDQGQAPAGAEALRTEFERPPFGWDGNAVKVGLALLLRISACKLIENSRSITDPLDPEAWQVLSKEQRFRSLRVQGVASTIDIPTLKQVRENMERVFGLPPKTPLVPDTLNNVLGEQLTVLAKEEQQVQSWATTAQCLLPVAFEAGSSLVDEMLNSALPQVRLPQFLEQSETLLQHTELLHNVASYQREYGSMFLKVRDFYNTMLMLDTDLPEVRGFINDWRTVATQERSVTDPARWAELVSAYNKANQAITDETRRRLDEAGAKLEALETEAASKLQEMGIPDEKAESEAASIRSLFDDVRARLERGTANYSEARDILTALNTAEINMRFKLRELRSTYDPGTGNSPEVVVQWQEVVGEPRVTISSMADFQRIVEVARARVQHHLDRKETVVIE